MSILAHAQLTCHPEARAALLAWRALRFQCALEELPLPIARFLLETTPVPVIRGKDGGFLFIGGFEIMELAESIGIMPCTCEVNPGPGGIERFSWSSVVRPLVVSIEREVGHAVFADVVNARMPPKLVRSLFRRKRLSATVLKRICRLSCRTIKSQRENRKRNDPAKAPPILSLLLKEKR